MKLNYGHVFQLAWVVACRWSPNDDELMANVEWTCRSEPTDGMLLGDASDYYKALKDAVYKTSVIIKEFASEPVKMNETLVLIRILFERDDLSETLSHIYESVRTYSGLYWQVEGDKLRMLWDRGEHKGEKLTPIRLLEVTKVFTEGEIERGNYEGTYKN